jgi:hypothetical protein
LVFEPRDGRRNAQPQARCPRSASANSFGAQDHAAFTRYLARRVDRRLIPAQPVHPCPDMASSAGARPHAAPSSGGGSSGNARRPLSSFLRQLFILVSDASNAHSVAWSPSGLTFVIKDINAFSQAVLPRYYKARGGASHAGVEVARRRRRSLACTPMPGCSASAPRNPLCCAARFVPPRAHGAAAQQLLLAVTPAVLCELGRRYGVSALARSDEAVRVTCAAVVEVGMGCGSSPCPSAAAPLTLCLPAARSLTLPRRSLQYS